MNELRVEVGMKDSFKKKLATSRLTRAGVKNGRWKTGKESRCTEIMVNPPLMTGVPRKNYYFEYLIINYIFVVCHLLGCSQRQKWRIPNLILFAWWQISSRNVRTRMDSLTQAFLCPDFVTLWIRQPVTGPPFPTTLIFRDWRHVISPLWPLLLPYSETKQYSMNFTSDRRSEIINPFELAKQHIQVYYMTGHSVVPPSRPH